MRLTKAHWRRGGFTALLLAGARLAGETVFLCAITAVAFVVSVGCCFWLVYISYKGR